MLGAARLVAKTCATARTAAKSRRKSRVAGDIGIHANSNCGANSSDGRSQAEQRIPQQSMGEVRLAREDRPGERTDALPRRELHNASVGARTRQDATQTGRGYEEAPCQEFWHAVRTVVQARE
jgi:hypothetical protein